MFDFEKLEVFGKAKTFHLKVTDLLDVNAHFSKTARDQLSRASLSITLNIAEGTSRFGSREKRNFYAIARGSAFECAAIFIILKERYPSESQKFQELYGSCDEISRMLFVMIKYIDANAGK